MVFVTIGHVLHGNVSFTLEVEDQNKAMNILIRWQGVTKQWTMTVREEDGTEILTHIPLMVGVEPLTANLLRIYAHKRLGMLFVIPGSKELSLKDPTRENLKSDYILGWGEL